MDTMKELESKSKAVYSIFFGCLPICLKEAVGTNDISARELQEKLHTLFISQDLVKAVHKESEPVHIIRKTVAEGISPRPPLRKGREVIRLDEWIRIDLNYSSEKLDPDYYDQHRLRQEIRGSLFYDGFTYVVALEQEKGKTFNLRRHVVHLQKWMADSITREKGITVVNVSPSPIYGAIRMYLLREPTEELEREEQFIFPTYVGEVTKRLLNFAYDVGEESVQEAIGTAVDILLLNLEERLREFYLCQILDSEILAENNRAREIIGRVTNESLSFYDISLFNVFRRLKKSREIGKELALLYALMAQVEQLGNEYESHRSQLNTEEVDKSMSALCEMLNSNLTLGEENIFTQRIREMLQQDVSEIRAQVNYQLLFISALFTFLAIIITAITTLFS